MSAMPCLCRHVAILLVGFSSLCYLWPVEWFIASEGLITNDLETPNITIVSVSHATLCQSFGHFKSHFKCERPFIGLEIETLQVYVSV